MSKHIQGSGRGWRLRLVGVAAVVTALFTSSPGRAQNITYSEVDLGLLAHDVHFLGGKEKGLDINPEVIFASPIEDATMIQVPWAFRWMVQPRLTLGAVVNTSGFTDQAYLGATWTWQLASNVFRQDDGITFGIFFGPGLNNGKIHSNDDARKNLGGHLLFREAFELGYRINPVWSVSAYLDHISNGGFDQYNQSINDFGGRIGMRF